MASSTTNQPQPFKTMPFRSFKEFLTDSKQYGMPAMNDLRKFNNRIISNLLYFQNNYFVVAAVIFILFLFCGFQKLIIGGIIVAPLVGLVLRQLGMTNIFEQIERQSPYAITVVTLGNFIAMYLAFNQIMYFVMAVSVPVGLSIVHAAFRKRGIVNKVNNNMDKTGAFSVYERTPMDILLKSVGIQASDYEKE